MNRQKAIKLLNLNPNFSDGELKKAFRVMAMKFHPDRNKSENAKEKFVEIYDAYNYLKDYKESASNYQQKSYSRSRANQKARSKSPNWEYSYRHQRAESFEERYQRAKRATEEKMEKDEEKIIQGNFNEYMNGWRRKYVRILTPIAALLSILLTIDYFLPAKQDYYSDVQTSTKPELLSTPNLYANFKNENILIDKKIYALLNYSTVSAVVNKRAIFGDIISVELTAPNSEVVIEPVFNIHHLFPLFNLLLFLPLISFFIEKPKFYFIFFVVYTNIYIISITVVVILANRIQTLLNI